MVTPIQVGICPNENWSKTRLTKYEETQQQQRAAGRTNKSKPNNKNTLGFAEHRIGEVNGEQQDIDGAKNQHRYNKFCTKIRDFQDSRNEHGAQILILLLFYMFYFFYIILFEFPEHN
ncbi:hypothetical protein ACP275_12G035000 [Erythranthe tilingii]